MVRGNCASGQFPLTILGSLVLRGVRQFPLTTLGILRSREGAVPSPPRILHVLRINPHPACCARPTAKIPFGITVTPGTRLARSSA